MEKVAVVFGGVSAEHDISIITAINSIIKPLELSGKYEVIPVYISKKGKWYSDPKLKQIDVYAKGEIDSLISKLKPVSLELGSGLSIVKSGLGSKKTDIDIVFPAMHGTYGENGDLMGVLDMAGIPYIGCSLEASAISMDKILSKRVAISGGYATPRYLSATKAEIDKEPHSVIKRIKDNLSYPLFVKPSHLGSSIAVSQVNSDKELSNALEVAATFDTDIIIEETVNNLIEVTLPIIGNDEPQPALLERPMTQAKDFFDFDTKYLRKGKASKGGRKGSQGYSEVPAKIGKDLYSKAEEMALDIYKYFNLSGIARVDMLIDSKSKTVYFNEINPLPGSLYIHNWNKAGISNVELVTKLVDLAKERFAKLSGVQTTFDTNFLKQF